jgi:hypothetical protein
MNIYNKIKTFYTMKVKVILGEGNPEGNLIQIYLNISNTTKSSQFEVK